MITRTMEELRIAKNYLEESMLECDTVRDALNMIEGEELLAMLKEQLNEDGDIDDVLGACRDLIAFHINDVNKFFETETEKEDSDIVLMSDVMREVNKNFRKEDRCETASEILARQTDEMQELYACIEHAEEDLLLVCQGKTSEHQDMNSVVAYLESAVEVAKLKAQQIF